MQIPFEVDPPSSEKGFTKSPDSEITSNSIASSNDIGQKSISVTKLTNEIKFFLEGKFRSLIVEGELSNLKKATSGHLYFILKDEKSQIRCVMFRQNVLNTPFQPENGLEVIVRGYLSVYKQRGEYQIIISLIEPKGLGSLQLAFDQLKTKLETEGLFLDKYKKKIPLLPRKIGILTSSTGAVIHDMIKVLNHRFAEMPVILFPVQVQGKLAVPSIIEGIKYLNSIRKSQKIDILILGRGGGSMEDLWSFNDEKLVRVIFSSEIPIISAVGHETDFTISDFVSDLRAPTPSAAIEMAVPQKKDLQYTLGQKQKQLKRSIIQKIKNYLEIYKSLIKRLDSPVNLVRQYSQLVDDLDSLLNERKNHKLEILKKYFEKVSEKLHLLNPKRELLTGKEKINVMTRQLHTNIELYKKECNEKMEQKIYLLETLSPLSVIARGYSITLDMKGNPIYSIRETHQGQKLQVKVKDGILHAKVSSKKNKKL